MSKENLAKILKEQPEPIPRENPFIAISKMVRTSVGRLPAHLVIIFFVSLVITILLGFLLRFAAYEADQDAVYLPERLMPQADKPALTEAQIEGIWVLSQGKLIATLRIGNGVFELVTRNADEPYSRYFARGGYKMSGNVLILQERKDLGTPYDPEHTEYKFYPLSMNAINLYAETNGRIMVWNTPGREQSRLDNPDEDLQIIFSDNVSWMKIAAKP